MAQGSKRGGGVSPSLLTYGIYLAPPVTQVTCLPLPPTVLELPLLLLFLFFSLSFDLPLFFFTTLLSGLLNTYTCQPNADATAGVAHVH